MATRPDLGIEVLLSAIPSLPRPVLARLTARMIDRMDELDGDPDLKCNGDQEDIDEREPEDEGGDYTKPPKKARRSYERHAERLRARCRQPRELHVLAPRSSLYVRLPRR